MNPIRLLIVDDERLFAEALEVLLATEERIEVVGKAHDGREAVRLARALQPAVVLMDLSMPAVDGFAAIAELAAECGVCRIVVLSGSADPDDMARAKAAGAYAYVTKENISETLVPCVLEAAV